jgi:hypothetical protein
MDKYIKTLFTNKSLFSDKSNEGHMIVKFRLNFLDKYKKTAIYICICI